MKGGSGDIIYCSYSSHEDRGYTSKAWLRIEVKLESPRVNSFQLTRSQYYYWIREEWRPEDRKPDRPDQPDIFIGVSRHGIAILPWRDFRDIYIREVYPSALPVIVRPKDRSPAPTGKFRMSYFDGSASDYFFPYSEVDQWTLMESRLVAWLEAQCISLIPKDPLQHLQVIPELSHLPKAKNASAKKNFPVENRVQ